MYSHLSRDIVHLFNLDEMKMDQMSNFSVKKRTKKINLISSPFSVRLLCLILVRCRGYWCQFVGSALVSSLVRLARVARFFFDGIHLFLLHIPSNL